MGYFLPHAQHLSRDYVVSYYEAVDAACVHEVIIVDVVHMGPSCIPKLLNPDPHRNVL